MLVRLTLAILWTLGIVVACSLPGSSLPSVTLLEADKLAHFVLFAGFGWLWMAALPFSARRRMFVVLAAGLVFAVLSEIYQSLLPFSREADPYDALADALGLCVGTVLYRLRERRSNP